ncbi:MAG: hypothetical protein JWO78_675 [Micavibrio sp.]|nr:hypothetical protein [Micavibrio sp.]
MALAIATLIFMPVSPARASKTVTSPVVNDGETTMELKGEYDVDDRSALRGAWNGKVNIAHSFTSFWSSEIETTVQQTGLSNARLDFSATEWKNKFQFTREKEFGFDTGMRITYSRNTSGDQDSVEVKLLAAKTLGPTSHRLNLIGTRVVGNAPAHAVSWGASWSSRYKITDAFQPGFEEYSAFGKIGNEQGFDKQDHRLGPVFYGKINDRVSYDAGYLVGLSHAAPDGTLKAILKYKF